METNMVNAKELSEVLNVPRSWVYRAARKNSIPHLKVGKYYRFNLGRVLEHLSSEKSDGKGEEGADVWGLQAS